MSIPASPAGRARNTGSGGIALCCCLIPMFASGCMVKETSLKGASRLVIPAGDTYEFAERREDLPDTPMITQTSMASTIAVAALGTVPYDGFTLPITSSSTEKQYVAVQLGPSIPIDIMLATGRGAATAGEVAIYECSADEDPLLVRTHSGSIILGRNSNREGVLVEKANADGSRWIGLAPWNGEDIRWIVSNSNVNAFGWVNEDSTLAYARRTTDETRFELVVRAPDGSAWIVEETLPYSWEYPMLAPSGESLFALRRGEGFADLAWGGADDELTFRDTLVLHRTSDRVDDLRAWETLAAAAGGAGIREGEVAWFSRELRRLVLWTPETREIKLLPEGTVAACKQSEAGEWLVTDADSLELAAILTTTTATSLIFEQPWIARPSIEENAILALARDGSLELALLKTTAMEAETPVDPVPKIDPVEPVPVERKATTIRDPRMD